MDFHSVRKRRQKERNWRLEKMIIKTFLALLSAEIEFRFDFMSSEEGDESIKTNYRSTYSIM